MQSDHFQIKKDRFGTSYIESRNEVLIIPIDDTQNIHFITEPTPAFRDHHTLLLPCGTIEDGESAEATAQRELQEEIGYRAEQLIFIGELHPWPKYLAVRTFIYIARGLVISPLPGDEPYPIHVHRWPLNMFDTLIRNGTLYDARAISAFYLVQHHMRADITI